MAEGPNLYLLSLLVSHTHYYCVLLKKKETKKLPSNLNHTNRLLLTNKEHSSYPFSIHVSLGSEQYRAGFAAEEANRGAHIYY